MKKVSFLMLFLCMILGLSSCSNKKGFEEEEFRDKREVSSKFDRDLVKKLEGGWVSDADGNYPAYGKRIIAEKGDYIFYDNQKLQITDAENNIVYTQTSGEKPFYYDFRLSDNKLEVLPSYPVPKGMTGGSLAPIQYVRDEQFENNISILLGEWQSVDESSTYYISIKQISDGVISYAGNLKNKDSQILIVQENFEDSISTLTEDERAIHHFRMLESETIEAYSQVNENYYTNRGEDIPVGMSKPIKYKKIIK